MGVRMFIGVLQDQHLGRRGGSRTGKGDTGTAEQPVRDLSRPTEPGAGMTFRVTAGRDEEDRLFSSPASPRCGCP